ncbi:hypothetical protein HanIR_Chr12g0612411 [Helianthus annuus]|nr:hypothetical protein HanIR_Chr12g0612411 [Helianthus annuus]
MPCPMWSRSQNLLYCCPLIMESINVHVLDLIYHYKFMTIKKFIEITWSTG